VAFVGSLAAAGVGYLVSRNPAAAPAHVAVALRVLIIVILVAGGIYGLAGRNRSRMGALLVGAGLYASLWLLNGSSERVLFSAGVFVSGAAPMLFAYLVLACPRGRLRSREERWLLGLAGGAGILTWAMLVITGSQPPIRTGLVECSPHCPSQALFVGSAGADVRTALEALMWMSWGAVVLGTPLLLWRASRTAAGPLRHAYVPLAIGAWASAACWAGFAVATAAGSSSAPALGGAYVGAAAVIALAILVRFALDRLLIGGALAAFVEELAARPHADPETLMARALHDPSLAIAYARPGRGAYVDASGAPVIMPRAESGRSIAWIQPHRGPIAAVVYDATLADQAEFVHAAGNAAAIRLEAAQLEAELRASTHELEASRRRLVEAADSERQRIERDLHDGVQQHVLGLRLKLDLAGEAIRADQASGLRMLSAVGQQLDELLGTLRLLARGIYPSILSERGLAEALTSVAFNVAIPVSVRVRGVGRYAEEIEVAVYFCCIEALQNITKHCGPTVNASIHVGERDDSLVFWVRDSGPGFNPGAAKRGKGLTNMSDRIAAVGGTLRVRSFPGRGTIVRGHVPLARPARSGAERR
jgi:signal transduction histidine kinase